MKRMRTVAQGVLLITGLALFACAAPAAPTPVPTKAPAAAPTSAVEPSKPAAPTATTPPAPTPTPRPATLKFGALQAISDAGIYIAIEKGFFKEQGITMEVVNFRSQAEVLAPLGTGQLDVVSMPLGANLIAAADRGVEVKIVGEKGQSKPNWEFSWIVLRKDLADSGNVKTVADLKGMKLAVPSPGSIGDITVRKVLQEAGLKPGDVEIVVIAPTDQAAALANKAIAAAYTPEPFIARGIQEGFSVKWLPNSQASPDKNAQNALIVFGSALLKDQDLARRWLSAYLKGARDYLKAFTTKEGRQEIVDILVKFTTVKDPKLYDVMEMPYLDPNGQPNMSSLEDQYQWYVNLGLYTGKKTLKDIMDLSFLEYAVQKLGKQ